MHAAARATSWPGAIKTGDLPPSSSVTGVSCAAGQAHHRAPHGGRAGEHDVVEGQGGEFAGVEQFLAHHRHLVFAERLGQQAAQAGVGGGRGLGHLHHHPVARGQRGGQRPQRQVDGKVPGHDHADHPLGLVGHAQAVGQEQQFGRAPARLHPAPEVAQGVVDLQRRAQDVEHLGFGRCAVAEVLAHGLGQHVLVAQQFALEAAQVVPALGGAGAGRLKEGVPLALEQGGVARWRGCRGRKAVVHACLRCVLAASVGSAPARREGQRRHAGGQTRQTRAFRGLPGGVRPGA